LASPKDIRALAPSVNWFANIRKRFSNSAEHIYSNVRVVIGKSISEQNETLFLLYCVAIDKSKVRLIAHLLCNRIIALYLKNIITTTANLLGNLFILFPSLENALILYINRFINYDFMWIIILAKTIRGYQLLIFHMRVSWYSRNLWALMYCQRLKRKLQSSIKFWYYSRFHLLRTFTAEDYFIPGSTY
jgi:hypothetical protein